MSKNIVLHEEVDIILRDMKNGNADALDRLYEHTKKPLMAICYSYFKNEYDSEDALHDAYVKIQTEIDKYKGHSGYNWIYTITKNVCLNILKRRERIAYVDFSDEKNLNYLGEDEGAHLHVHDESGIFALAKEILTYDEFRIVTMHAVGGLKHSQIAKIMGRLEPTVRWKYNNALKKIRTHHERRGQK